MMKSKTGYGANAQSEKHDDGYSGVIEWSNALITLAAGLVMLAFALVFATLQFMAELLDFAVVLFVVLPFKIAQIILRRRVIPLPQRNLTRATAGAFVLTFVVTLSNRIRLDDTANAVVGGVALVALLYLWVGYRGSRGVACDVMSVIWWGFGALCFVVLLSYGPGTRINHAVLQSLSYAGLAACALRIWLLLRPVPGAALPHPSTVQGMPMAGPASVSAAHAAMSRRGNAARPKFKV